MAIQITNAQELQDIRMQPPDQEYILANDIDLSGFTWEPYAFYGTFDFNGKTISNLTLNLPDQSAALFGYFGGTILGELHLENFNITGRDAAGFAASATLNNPVSFSRWSLSGDITSLDSSAGGLFIDLNFGSGVTDEIEINNFSFSGTISSTSTVGCFAALVQFACIGFNISNCNLSEAVITGEYNVGGMFGILDASSLVMSNCIFSGNISGSSHVGGLVGAASITYAVNVDSCIVDGSIALANRFQSFAGGLFGNLAADSFVLLNCSLNCSIFGSNHIGGLIGSAVVTTPVSVENCSFTGVMQILSDEYRGYIGGLFGKVNKGIFRDCILKTNIVGESFIGGLCGYFGKGSFANCSFEGNISGCYALGSMCGSFNEVELTDCTASGVITGVIVDGSYPTHIGGLLGGKSGVASLLRCAFSGEIAGNSYIGGLVSNVHSPGGNIENCHSEGVIINIVSDGAPYCIGGLAGKFAGNIANSFSNCEINTDSTCTAVGGLVGDCEGNILKSYFEGDIPGYRYIGGLCGTFEIGSIKECWAKGVYTGAHGIGCLVGKLGENANIENTFGRGSVSGQDSVGGLVGAIYYTDTTIITNSYAATVVTISGSSECGGLIGTSNVEGAVITSCYYDSQVSGQSDNDGRGVPKTTEEMKTQGTYGDWDFEATWGMISYYNEGYPALTNAIPDLVVFFSGIEDDHWYNENKSPDAIVTNGEIYQVTMERSNFSVEGYSLGDEMSEQGHYVLDVMAKNETEDKEFRIGFYIDKTAPLITTTPVIAEGATIMGDFLLSVTVTDIIDNDGTTSTITLDGEPFTSGSNVSNGVHVLVVNAEDRAGNTSTATINFTVLPYWARKSKLISVPLGKKVVSAKIEVIANDLEEVKITDIQFQGGNILTGWVPHVADAVANVEKVFVIGTDKIGQKYRTIGA